MRFVCLAPHVPYPRAPHAGGLFLHHYLMGLSRTFDVRLLCPATVSNTAAASECSPSISLHLFPLRQTTVAAHARAYWFARRVLAGLTPGPQALAALRADPVAGQWVRGADVVEVQWAEYLRMVPIVKALNRRAPIGIVEHDVAVQALRRRARSSPSVRERVAARIQLKLALKQEPALINQCSVAYVFKAGDAALLESFGVTTPIRVFDPYLEIPEGPARTPRTESVLFVGALSRPENSEGVHWFLTRVWPTVVRQRPDARMVIAGADPPWQLRKQVGQRITVTGWVDSLDDFYREASVFVAPLLSGAGLRFKVAQAMRYGLPVVGTSLALEGISPPAPGSAVGGICDDADDMARCIASLLADPALAARVGANATTWAAQRYSFDRTIQTALDEYTTLASPRE
jgi:glycosyltransferase involved in cell wall biosynthesis